MPTIRESNKFYSRSDGSVRGLVKFRFADGRTDERRVNAGNKIDYEKAVSALTANIDLQREKGDAEMAALIRLPIEPHLMASELQVAHGYLEVAARSDTPLEAYDMFVVFGVWQLKQRIADKNMVAHLSDEGLIAERWEYLKRRRDNLLATASVVTLAGYKTLLDADMVIYHGR